MKTIEYRVQFTGATGSPRSTMRAQNDAGASYEVVRVQAVNINAGFTKALKKALQPLGNGLVREIGAIEFWQVV
jgi:hypothetical protein